ILTARSAEQWRRRGWTPRRSCGIRCDIKAITHLVQAGIDLPTVQRISGHKTLAMVARYAHANGAHVQAAMSALERRYRPAVEEQREPAEAEATSQKAVKP